MNRDAQEALHRLKTLVQSRSARTWLDQASAEQAPDGSAVLRVSGPFQKRWLEEHCGEALRSAFRGSVEVVAERKASPGPLGRTAKPRPQGAGGEFAARAVRAFVEQSLPSARLLVLHGPEGSGKALLAEYAARRAPKGAFRLDLRRLKSGVGRGLVPRKPFVVAESLETLAGCPGAQRALCSILDALWDRGGRALVTVDFHPAQGPGLGAALQNRLLGGILVPLTLAGGKRARPSPLPGGRQEREPVYDAADPEEAPSWLDELKDAAAQACGVERTLLEGGTRRRRVVEARRVAMTLASRAGLSEPALAKAFRLKSTRTVREACRWAEAKAARDPRFGALLREVARVAPLR